MKQTAMLIWKEAREIRWALYTCLLLLLSFGLLSSLVFSRYSTPMHPRLMASELDSLLLALGGPMALLIAVGVACRDLRQPVLEFWSSRPIGLTHLFVTKYLTGLAGVLIILMVVALVSVIPLIGHLWPLSTAVDEARLAPYLYSPNRLNTALNISACLGWTLMLIYSVSFLIGCLVRRAAPSAVLGMAAGLLILFLPMIIPPLGALSVFNHVMNSSVQLTTPVHMHRHLPWFDQMHGWNVPGASLTVLYRAEYFWFAGAMLAGVLVTGVLAWWALRRDWRVQMDQRLMMWTLGLVAILLFASTAYQIGSNLTPQQEVRFASTEQDRAKDDTVATIADRRRILTMTSSGQRVLMATLPGALPRNTRQPFPLQLQTFDLSQPDGGPGPLLRPEVSLIYRQYGMTACWPADQGHYAYLLHVHPAVEGGYDEVAIARLLTVDLTGAPTGLVTHELDLLQHLPGDVPPHAEMFLFAGKLYIKWWQHVVIIDVSDPAAPQVSDVMRNPRYVPTMQEVSARTLVVNMIDWPGMNARQRLEASMLPGWGPSYGLDGDLLVRVDQEHVKVFQLTELNQTTATFELIGQRAHTPLERLWGFWPKKVMVQDKRAFVLGHTFSQSLLVYDLSEPSRPQRVGHFTTPQQWKRQLAMTSDGRLILGADRLYVFAFDD